MKRLETDVLVLGSGLAGLTAAIEAREAGARVLVLGKGPLGRNTCSTMAVGAFTASNDGWPVEAHREATFEAGRGLNDPALVDLVCGRAHETLEKLRRWGVPLLPSPTGYRVEGPEVGLRVPGNALAEALRRRALARAVESLAGAALEVLVEDGAAAGVLALAPDGSPLAVSARAVVLATGGACALWARHDNPPELLGGGYALALRAGCRLRDMELVQFYPLGLAQPGLPEFLVYPPYPPEATVRDASGLDLLPELGDCRTLGDATTKYRDTASLLFWRAHREGGAFLDLTAVEESRWSSTYSLRVLGRSSFDFRRRPCRIAPLAHFFIGGVEVDSRLATSLPGLYAAGEVVGGLHGANRLGGNALSECAVCGTVAGVEAAGFAGSRAAPRSSGPESDDTTDFGGRSPAGPALLRRLRTLAWEHAGVVRDAEGMERGLVALDELEAEFDRLPERSSTRLDLASSLLVLRSTLRAGLLRRESRGAFYRSDFPQRDDERWQRPLYVSATPDGGVLVEGAP